MIFLRKIATSSFALALSLCMVPSGLAACIVPSESVASPVSCESLAAVSGMFAPETFGATDNHAVQTASMVCSPQSALEPATDSPLISEDSLQTAKLELAKVRESFINTTLVSYSPSDEVTRNYLKYSENGRAAIDVLLMQLYLSVQLPPDEVSRVMELFDFDKRQWKDIDYTDMSRGGWDMTLHITRIYALAKSYKWPQSPYYLDSKLSELLHKAAGWWFDNMPVNPNWWHNDIGVPKKLSAAMILLHDELTDQEIEGALKVLERSRFGRTGQNKAWLAGNQLMKALLIDDPELAAEAQRQIAEEIYVTDGEGIQSDWSFHQHGPQLQFGNYGLAFAEGVSFWIRVLNGTAYSFSDQQVEIMENFILNGLCWTLWKGLMDPSACGRQLHIDGGRGKAYSCAVAAFNMSALGRPKSKIFEQVALQNLQPELYENGLVGATYYPRSDFGIYRTKDWYSSIRMHSERTIGYEFTNSENQLAQFSADGALLLMQTGDEYENIFPYWDWRKLPGVTAYYDGKPFKTSDKQADKQNNTEHVGGIAEGDAMVTTMELEKDGLHALKTNFFLGDIIVSLGSDIRRSREDITRMTTALDQNHLVVKGTLAPDVKTGSFRSKKSALYNSGVHDTAASSSSKSDSRGRGKVDWAWHNDRGYVVLDGAKLNVAAVFQSGNWSDMAPMYNKADMGMVFNAWVEHPADGISGYAYALLPSRTANQTKSFAKAVASGKAVSSCKAVSGKGNGKTAASGKDEVNVPVVLCNDACCQAVLYKGNVYAAIHREGTYTFGGQTIGFSEPALYMCIGGETLMKTIPHANIPAANQRIPNRL